MASADAPCRNSDSPEAASYTFVLWGYFPVRTVAAQHTGPPAKACVNVVPRSASRAFVLGITSRYGVVSGSRSSTETSTRFGRRWTIDSGADVPPPHATRPAARSAATTRSRRKGCLALGFVHRGSELEL